MPALKRRRVYLILPPVIVGVLLLFLLANSRQPPTKVERTETARAVRVISVPEVDLTPVAEGYGTVQPAKVWTAVAEVPGRIIEMHPRLRNGEIIPSGELLYRIDPVDYELELEQLNAELAELEVKQSNTEYLLKIEQNSLQLAEREFERLSKLAKQGTTSQSKVDDAQRAMLASNASAQNLRNTLALLPTQRRVIEAKLARAERNLQKTSVIAPFNLRVADLAMEIDQYATAGQKLFAGDSVDRAEVVAQVAISSLRHLFANHAHVQPTVSMLGEDFPKFAGLQSIIQMDMGGFMAEWDAEFVRFTDRIDAETRTIGVVVAVDKPFEKVVPGRRPPLSKGMFVKIKLSGRPQSQRLLIPRTAVRNGNVLIVDDQNKLIINPVEIDFHQGDLTVVASGVETGDKLVVSDLIPTVAGMPLIPQPDENLQRHLLDQAGAAQ